MKSILSLSSLFLFAFCSMSYAANQESGSISFPDTVRVGTNNLPAGTYTVHWQLGSSDVQLTLSGKGHQISVPATVSTGVGQDQVLLHKDGSAEVLDGFTVKDTNFSIKAP